MINHIRALFSKKRPADEADVLLAGEVVHSEGAGSVQTDERPIVRFGMLVLIVGFGGFLLWAGLAPLDEGVPGTGVVSVDSKR